MMDSEYELSYMNDLLESSSSDDDNDLYIAAANIVANDTINHPCHGGSVDGHRVLNRDRQYGHNRLYEDYFLDNPTYGPNYFRRRFVLSPID